MTTRGVTKRRVPHVDANTSPVKQRRVAETSSDAYNVSAIRLGFEVNGKQLTIEGLPGRYMTVQAFADMIHVDEKFQSCTIRNVERLPLTCVVALLEHMPTIRSITFNEVTFSPESIGGIHHALTSILLVDCVNVEILINALRNVASLYIETCDADLGSLSFPDNITELALVDVEIPYNPTAYDNITRLNTLKRLIIIEFADSANLTWSACANIHSLTAVVTDVATCIEICTAHPTQYREVFIPKFLEGCIQTGCKYIPYVWRNTIVSDLQKLSATEYPVTSADGKDSKCTSKHVGWDVNIIAGGATGTVFGTALQCSTLLLSQHPVLDDMVMKIALFEKLKSESGKSAKVAKKVEPKKKLKDHSTRYSCIEPIRECVQLSIADIVPMYIRLSAIVGERGGHYGRAAKFMELILEHPTDLAMSHLTRADGDVSTLDARLLLEHAWVVWANALSAPFTALIRMHRAYLLHLDVKPHNVLYTAVAQGVELRLADFGNVCNPFRDDDGMEKLNKRLGYDYVFFPWTIHAWRKSKVRNNKASTAGAFGRMVDDEVLSPFPGDLGPYIVGCWCDWFGFCAVLYEFEYIMPPKVKSILKAFTTVCMKMGYDPKERNAPDDVAMRLLMDMGIFEEPDYSDLEEGEPVVAPPVDAKSSPVNQLRVAETSSDAYNVSAIRVGFENDGRRLTIEGLPGRFVTVQAFTDMIHVDGKCQSCTIRNVKQLPLTCVVALLEHMPTIRSITFNEVTFSPESIGGIHHALTSILLVDCVNVEILINALRNVASLYIETCDADLGSLSFPDNITELALVDVEIPYNPTAYDNITRLNTLKRLIIIEFADSANLTWSACANIHSLTAVVTDVATCIEICTAHPTQYREVFIPKFLEGCIQTGCKYIPYVWRNTIVSDLQKLSATEYPVTSADGKDSKCTSKHVGWDVNIIAGGATGTVFGTALQCPALTLSQHPLLDGMVMKLALDETLSSELFGAKAVAEAVEPGHSLDDHSTRYRFIEPIREVIPLFIADIVPMYIRLSAIVAEGGRHSERVKQFMKLILDHPTDLAMAHLTRTDGAVSNISPKLIGDHLWGVWAKALSAPFTALIRMHRAGLLHLDVKPDNVLYTAVGAGVEIRLADFGDVCYPFRDDDELEKLTKRLQFNYIYFPWSIHAWGEHNIRDNKASTAGAFGLMVDDKVLTPPPVDVAPHIVGRWCDWFGFCAVLYVFESSMPPKVKSLLKAFTTVCMKMGYDTEEMNAPDDVAMRLLAQMGIVEERDYEEESVGAP